MTLTRQQEFYAVLREAARGDIRLIERAISEATQDSKGEPPDFKAVLSKIDEILAQKVAA